MAVGLALLCTCGLVVDGRVRPPEQRREPAVGVVEREDQRLGVRRDDAVDRVPVPDLTPAVAAVAQDLERREQRRCVARRARVEADARPDPEPPLEPVRADLPAGDETRPRPPVAALDEQRVVDGDAGRVDVGAARGIHPREPVVERLAQDHRNPYSRPSSSASWRSSLVASKRGSRTSRASACASG